MRKIAISLSKGGVGKTTTAVNLAHALAHRGRRVLLVDLDTQGQDAGFLGLKESLTNAHGLAAIIKSTSKAGEAIVEARNNLWLLPGGRSLVEVRQLIDQQTIAPEHTLAEALEDVEEHFDYVILDTAPGWDSLTANALFYATEILMPASLESATLQGIVEFQESLARVQKYHKGIVLRYVVPTMYDRRVKKSDEVLGILQQHFDERVCQPIRYSVRLSESAGFGQTIFEYDPTSQGAQDYAQLALTVDNHGN